MPTSDVGSGPKALTGHAHPLEGDSVLGWDNSTPLPCLTGSKRTAYLSAISHQHSRGNYKQHESYFRANLVILNRDQMTRTTPEQAPSLQTSAPHLWQLDYINPQKGKSRTVIPTPEGIHLQIPFDPTPERV
ncbi:hypothetical protein AVEN_188247-1 [Araneus ventricosus]|uniref:Uncharacterized protein n=1 Tax=Araneus ventricosus TaxID=182803 RepID=A0A4Y2HD35_ARAVE|nr:hypothetical protein AVEN_188247-1 [Araneus ventricosus]